MYGSNWLAVITFFLIVFVAAVFNSVSALLCSAICKKTSVAMLVSYSIVIVVYFLPVAAYYIASNVSSTPEVMSILNQVGMASPLMTCFQVPLDENLREGMSLEVAQGSWTLVLGYFAITLGAVAVMFAVIAAFLRNRWGMTGR